jgi:hypothetical protein
VSLSILIPWANRPELAVSLRRNAPVFEALDAEVIISNCAGNRDQLQAIVGDAQNPRVRAIDCPSPIFNKCLAINAASRAAQGDVLFLLDADIVLRSDFTIPPGILERRCFSTIWRVRDEGASSDGGVLAAIDYSMTMVFKDGPPLEVQTGRHFIDGGGRSGPGLALVHRADFEAVGGMNSALVGWGWEDLDLLIRLERVLGIPRVHENEAIHLAHGDDRRHLPPGMSRLDSERRNRTVALAKYVAGDWMGTLATDFVVAEEPAVAPRAAMGRRS